VLTLLGTSYISCSSSLQTTEVVLIERAVSASCQRARRPLRPIRQVSAIVVTAQWFKEGEEADPDVAYLKRVSPRLIEKQNVRFAKKINYSTQTQIEQKKTHSQPSLIA
jgi:hypothetical protein